MRTTSSRHCSHGSLPPFRCAYYPPASELPTRVCARRAPVAVDAALQASQASSGVDQRGAGRALGRAPEKKVQNMGSLTLKNV